MRPTGSHFDSLKAVIAGEIDVAMVDVIVLMNFKDQCPEEYTKYVARCACAPTAETAESCFQFPRMVLSLSAQYNLINF